MYLELSRPAGDVSRWEKVLKRLTILNKHYPINSQNCDAIEFQRKMSDQKNTDKIYDTVKRTLIDQGCVFFGGFAVTLYSKYIPSRVQNKISKNPDFDVLSEEPEMTAEVLKERLTEIGMKRVKITKIPGLGEIISSHYEVTVGDDTVAMIYEPLACHSYNVISQDNDEIYVATIDTMLSFYLAFLYVDDFAHNYDPERVMCMSHYLFNVQQHNRLNQKGVLKRFSLNCIGHQETVEEMRAHKSEKFTELKNKKNSKEYEEWFLRYRPTDNKAKKGDKQDAANQKEERKKTPLDELVKPVKTVKLRALCLSYKVKLIFYKGQFMATAATTRTVNRGVNPFAPIAKLHNQRLSPAQNASIYVPIPQRASAVHNNSSIQNSLKNLATRMAGQKFSNKHCGELVWVRFVDLDINVEIQRDAEAEHQAKIIERFDPRIYMPIMATRMANGRYSAWEGQQTACTLYHLHQAGLLEDDFMVQVKAYDEDLEVPGSDLKGEAVGNYGFRQINGGMRKPIDAYHLHRSRVNGVRLYGSTFDEDVQSEEIQQILQRNHPRPNTIKPHQAWLLTFMV